MEHFRLLSLKRFSVSNSVHLAKQSRLCALYDHPSELTNAPSPFLKLPADLPPGKELNLFNSSVSWISATELSLRLLEHLATYYSDLFRAMAYASSTQPSYAVSLPVIASMVGSALIEVFTTVSSSPPSPPTGSPVISANSAFAGSSTNLNNSSGNLTAGSPASSASSLFGTPSPTPHSSSSSSLFGPYSNPNAHSTNNTHLQAVSNSMKDLTRPFETRLPELIPILFDSPVTFEEVFAVAMYIVHFLVSEKMQLTMLKMPGLITKVQQRIRKLFSKVWKLSEFKSYANKAVKPTTPEAYDDAAAHKAALLQTILAHASEEESHDAILNLTSILNEEEKTVVHAAGQQPGSSQQTHNSPHPQHSPPNQSPITTRPALGKTPSSSPPSSTRRVSSTSLTDDRSRKSPDQSPARARVSKKLAPDSPSRKRKLSASQQTGWAWLRPHMPQLIATLVSGTKYENMSFLVPHIVESRLFVNSLLKLVDTFVERVSDGIADVDSAVRAHDRLSLSSQSPYAGYVEYLRLNNSVAACHMLHILLVAMKHENKPADVSKPALLSRLLESDLITSVTPHFEFLNSKNFALAEQLQSAIVDRILDFQNFHLNASKPEHLKYFTGFWRACFGENSKQLTGAISKQWHLLGFAEEDPSKVLKNMLPYHFLTYFGDRTPERLEVVLERLLLRSEDYPFVAVLVELSEMVVAVTQACIVHAKLLPVLFSHNYFFEELCQESLYAFDALWKQQGFTKNSPDNVKSCIQHIKRVLFARLQTQTNLASVVAMLHASVPKFGSDEALDLPTHTCALAYTALIDEKYKTFQEAQAEITRLRREKLQQQHNAKVGGKRKSRRSSAAQPPSGKTSPSGATLLGEKTMKRKSMRKPRALSSSLSSETKDV